MDTMRRFVVGTIIGLLGTATAVAQVPADGRPLTLGVYWVATHCDGKTTRPLRWREKRSDHCLDRNPILDQRDVVSAAFDTGAFPKWTLKLTFREPTAHHLMEISAHRIGDLVATVVNGELVSVAMIQAPVDHLWISGLTEQEGRSLIDAVQRGAVSQTAAVLPPGPEHQPPDANGVYAMSPGISPPMLIHKEEPSTRHRRGLPEFKALCRLKSS